MTRSDAAPYLVRQGDVFIVRGNGSKNLCGLAGRVTQVSNQCIFPDLFIRISLPPALVLPEYFVMVWNGRTNRTYIEDAAKTTSGIWKINQGHIERAAIPLPHLDEQRRVVRELDALQIKVEAIRALQTETAAELDAMIPAILDKAFKGGL
jgi:type I restriction enzyme S subunit